MDQDDESSGIKAFDNTFFSKSLKYKHWYLRFTVEEKDIDIAHSEFENSMKDFLKKNKGKILHINKYKQQEVRCYFAVNLKEFPEWKTHVQEVIKEYMKPMSLPSFVEFN